MKAQIDRIRTVLERHQRDPRVKLFGVGELVADLRQVFSDLAEIESAHLAREREHASLVARLAELEHKTGGLAELHRQVAELEARSLVARRFADQHPLRSR